MKYGVTIFALFAIVSAIPAPHHHLHETDIGTETTSTTASPAQPSIADTTVSVNAATATANDEHPHSHNDHHTSSVIASSNPVQATATVRATKSGTRTTTTAAGSVSTSSSKSGSIDPNLVPDFGQQAGLQPDGTGNCKANSGTTIPCKCPPDRDAFIAKLEEFVNAGSFFGLLAAPFPTGNSNQDALTRIDTIISTLQNFDGSSGAGCPAASAPNFSTVQCNLLRATGGTCNKPSAGG